MAYVKEVKILKDGEMVTPKTLVDSVYNLDGTKYKDLINTALGQKLKIGRFESKKIDITQDTTETLPYMNVGEVSVFNFFLDFNASSVVDFDTEISGSGKYLVIFAEPSVYGSGSIINDRRIEINMLPDYFRYRKVHDTISHKAYTTWIYLLVIRFE